MDVGDDPRGRSATASGRRARVVALDRLVRLVPLRERLHDHGGGCACGQRQNLGLGAVGHRCKRGRAHDAYLEQGELGLDLSGNLDAADGILHLHPVLVDGLVKRRQDVLTRVPVQHASHRVAVCVGVVHLERQQVGVGVLLGPDRVQGVRLGRGHPNDIVLRGHLDQHSVGDVLKGVSVELESDVGPRGSGIQPPVSLGLVDSDLGAQLVVTRGADRDELRSHGV